MKTFNKNLILIALLIIMVIVPLAINKNAEFGGADGEAEGVIVEVSPNYEPWFSSIWEPPSGEIESLLFALQAALGAGIIAYYFGFMKGKRNSADNR
ncbi:energy-coupling factor ABC transporter substrate-binding protein [Sporosalibacterium faouarense]|uniref:energy-coupling factor ABC transporter substrate-binding protein n=1 Tax=Sporosalibacterium faouarense TaxID=516123 RepID=UPI00192AC8C4|nr:energy-coupling factor ABC transporter substrate-binding protein [Sporosalibacterium faouarense]